MITYYLRGEYTNFSWAKLMCDFFASTGLGFWLVFLIPGWMVVLSVGHGSARNLGNLAIFGKKYLIAYIFPEAPSAVEWFPLTFETL